MNGERKKRMDIIKSEMHLEITISIIIFLRVNAKEKKWGALGDLFKKKSMCSVFLIGNRQRLANVEHLSSHRQMTLGY